MELAEHLHRRGALACHGLTPLLCASATGAQRLPWKTSDAAAATQAHMCTVICASAPSGPSCTSCGIETANLLCAAHARCGAQMCIQALGVEGKGCHHGQCSSAKCCNAGEYADGLKRRLKLAVPDAIIEESFLGPADLAHIFSATLLNVHPCLYDAFGMTIIEAASQGLPLLPQEPHDRHPVCVTSPVKQGLQPAGDVSLYNHCENSLNSRCCRSAFAGQCWRKRGGDRSALSVRGRSN